MLKSKNSAEETAPVQPLILQVDDLSCASCVSRVEKTLAAVSGVQKVNVNLATGRATVWADNLIVLEELIKASTKAGYPARSVQTNKSNTDNAEKETRELRNVVLVAAALTLPVFLLDMGSHLHPGLGDLLSEYVGMQNLYYLYFVLASAVQFGPGLRFYLKGWPALLRGAPDMNSLVMLGTTAAWGYSVAATFTPDLFPGNTGNTYFEASAVIITLVSLGRYLESIARGRTSSAIRKLLDLQAETASVVRGGGEVALPIEDIEAGDLIRVRPGERIALDGVVGDGESFVDESMISGESTPIRKKSGDEVIGGTINQTGTFTFKVTRTGGDTVLAQIIRMVEQAQSGKLPIQALVDKFTGYFVPLVMLVAMLTFTAWYILGPDPAVTFALINAVAVLIIACPCAMGLATPTSIMVATGKAAESGILFRQGDALQKLREAEIIALDKTGTLTIGRPALTDFYFVNGWERSDLLSLVASAEKLSEHPIARAIVDEATQKGIKLKDVQEFNSHSGLGIEARVQSNQMQIGSARFMNDCNIEISEFSEVADQYSLEGKSLFFIGVNGKCVGLMAVADTLKEHAAKAVESFRKIGLSVVMITGDNQQTSKAIAHKLGIVDIVAEVRPDGKVAALQRLKADGRKVVFVGDGINDAPALATADVGIAIGSGTDIAIESAEVVLMSDDLGNVAKAINLSHATIRNIKENLFWAFAYNTSLIPVASGVLYPAFGVLLSPIFAAFAMTFSSICVLANSLRLKRINLH